MRISDWSSDVCSSDLGFLSKEMFLAEALETHSGTVLDSMLPVLATVASVFSVLYSVRFIHQTFLGPPPVDLPRKPRAAQHWLRFPIEVLVLVCLVVGIIPAMTIGHFLATDVHSVVDGGPSSEEGGVGNESGWPCRARRSRRN